MANVVRTREDFEGQFECRHCELDVPATVKAVGWGAQSRYRADTPEEQALEDAEGVASRTLQFVKCPRCGKIDPSGRSYRIQVIVGSLVIGLLAMGGTFLLAKMKARSSTLSRNELLVLAAACGSIFTALLYWKWSRPWRGAAKRTRIHYTPQS